MKIKLHTIHPIHTPDYTGYIIVNSSQINQRHIIIIINFLYLISMMVVHDYHFFENKMTCYELFQGNDLTKAINR